MEIGQSIQEARKKAKLTQKELAEKVGIATITVQQYERGVRTPKIETLQKIAQALNIDVGVLYGEVAYLRLVDKSEQTDAGGVGSVNPQSCDFVAVAVIDAAERILRD